MFISCALDQAEMVQALCNEVQRLGTEHLQEIQRLRAEQLLTVPPVEPSEGADAPPPTQLLQDAESSTREIGKSLVFFR